MVAVEAMILRGKVMMSFNSTSSGIGAGAEDETMRVKRAAMYEKIDMFRNDGDD